MALPRIRLVTFDVLHTLITPRLPTHVQYSEVFAPYLGVLEPDSLKHSFKIALKELQAKKPAYLAAGGTQAWWSEVIRKTALLAGADRQALDASLAEIVTRLMTRFSSKEGYKAFGDALPVMHHLNDGLNIPTAIVSNADSRIRLVLKDLKFPSSIAPIVLSEEEGIEKPSREIFSRALQMVNSERQIPIRPEECLHVGDELDCDYNGALNAGMNALLLRRLGPEAHEANDLTKVHVISSLEAVIDWVEDKAKE